MAKIIAETYTSPKQTTSRMNNTLSSLSSATSVHLSTGSPVSKTHPAYCRMFQTLQIGTAGTAPHCCRHCMVCRPKQRRMHFCSSYLFEIHLEKVKTVLCKRAFYFACVCLAGIKSHPQKSKDLPEKWYQFCKSWPMNLASHVQTTDVSLASLPLAESICPNFNHQNKILPFKLSCILVWMWNCNLFIFHKAV